MTPIAIVDFVTCACMGLLALVFLRGVPARLRGVPAVLATAAFVVCFATVKVGLSSAPGVELVLLVTVCAYVRGSRAVDWASAVVPATVFAIALDMGDVVILAAAAMLRDAVALEPVALVDFVGMRAATLGVNLASAVALSKPAALFARRLHLADLRLLALPILTFALFRTAFSDVLQPDGLASGTTAALAALLALSTLVTLIASGHHLAAEQRRVQAAEAMRMLDHQRRAYELRLASDDAVRRMRHDILNQLALVEGTQDGEARRRHLDAIRERVAPPSSTVKTNNAVLDVVLGQKMAEAAAVGVGIEAVANLQDAGFIDGVDICSIFANALENAIEACAALDDGRPKTVVLRAGTVQGHLVIKVQNPYSGERRRVGGLFVTTKGDAVRTHGVGLSSIGHSAARYGGVLQTEAAEGLFVLSVVIPLP